MMRTVSLLIAACMAASSHGAAGQTWPVKPLHAIVPFGAGTTTDIVPRIVLEQVSAQLGQPIVVENRPGAGGTTGSASVAKAEADGYTILVNSSAHTIAPALYAHLDYDPVRDLLPVAPLGMVPSVLLAKAGFKSTADLVQAAKTKPGGLNFASAGVGSATHLSAVRFNTSAEIDAVHVPFKAAPEILGEMLAGRIDYFLAPIAVAKPFVQDGKLAALAVNTSARLEAIPTIPTLAEAGISNAEYSFWIGVFVPSKTPTAIVERLAQEIRKALAMPKVSEKLATLGIEPMDMKPGGFVTLVSQQFGTDADLVHAAGLKPQ